MEVIEVSTLSKLPSPLNRADIKKQIRKILNYLIDNISYEISVIITSDLEIQNLNKEKRNKNKPTDVLSFPAVLAELQLPYLALGEVVISIDTAKSQAKKIGHSLREEFYRLLVHGILHLLGYDHEKSQYQAKKMRRKEDECLSIIFKKSCL
ncbi:MAG: rRNA maturation RNase YbeY [Leptospiraceae bacterium]|nr:rRNA maturation RNase YbeY [Leptospiraceae bacterium]NUM40032.1 rRNA maturation RNase YbeY [Leptospiraceae bacterium]